VGFVCQRCDASFSLAARWAIRPYRFLRCRYAPGMSKEPEQPTAADAWQTNQACEGRPQLFSYPAPLPPSEEDRERYAEAGKLVDEVLAKQAKRKLRRR